MRIVFDTNDETKFPRDSIFVIAKVSHINEVVLKEIPVDSAETRHSTEVLARAALEGGRCLAEYVKQKAEWNEKSAIEQAMLVSHDLEKGYKGSAPAGKPEVTYGCLILRKIVE